MTRVLVPAYTHPSLDTPPHDVVLFAASGSIEVAEATPAFPAGALIARLRREIRDGRNIWLLTPLEGPEEWVHKTRQAALKDALDRFVVNRRDGVVNAVGYHLR